MCVTLPCFQSVGVGPSVRTSHPSGSRPWEKSRWRVSSRPWQITCPRKLSVPRRVQGYNGSQILWLIPCGRPTLMWLTAWAYPLIKSSPSCLSYTQRDLVHRSPPSRCCSSANQSLRTISFPFPPSTEKFDCSNLRLLENPAR